MRDSVLLHACVGPVPSRCVYAAILYFEQAGKHSRGRCRIVAVSEMISWQFFESAQNRRVLLIEPVVVLEKQIFGESPRQLDARKGRHVGNGYGISFEKDATNGSHRSRL